jgi:hypothetical protein
LTDAYVRIAKRLQQAFRAGDEETEPAASTGSFTSRREDHEDLSSQRRPCKNYGKRLASSATTLFHQVFGYLREKPDPPKRLSGSMVGREGIAAGALPLRTLTLVQNSGGL